jgi:putative flippase GtrA
MATLVLDWRSRAEWKRVARYYQAGVVNTAFGFGLFALLIWAGLNLYLAQVVSYVLGTIFNYLTYSRYAFAGHGAAKGRFIISYALNYVLSLAVLWGFDRFVTSPYLAGFLTTVFVSMLNYFVLKKFVFRGAGP